MHVLRIVIGLSLAAVSTAGLLAGLVRRDSEVDGGRVSVGFAAAALWLFL